jgi:hypothetical protein
MPHTGAVRGMGQSHTYRLPPSVTDGMPPQQQGVTALLRSLHKGCIPARPGHGAVIKQRGNLAP